MVHSGPWLRGHVFNSTEDEFEVLRLDTSGQDVDLLHLSTDKATLTEIRIVHGPVSSQNRTWGMLKALYR